MSNSRLFLYAGAILFILGTGIERFSAYIKDRGKTPRYIGLNKLKKLENLRKFLSVKRAELDRSERNQIIVIQDNEHELFGDLKRFCCGPDEPRLPLKLVESHTPIVNIRDISTGERIGSTEYSPAVLAATGWKADYDNLIMGLEEDAQLHIENRARIFNYVGYALIVIGTLVMAYSGLIASSQ